MVAIIINSLRFMNMIRSLRKIRDIARHASVIARSRRAGRSNPIVSLEDNPEYAFVILVSLRIQNLYHDSGLSGIIILKPIRTRPLEEAGLPE